MDKGLRIFLGIIGGVVILSIFSAIEAAVFASMSDTLYSPVIGFLIDVPLKCGVSIWGGVAIYRALRKKK